MTMDKPRMFLGSSTAQARLVEALAEELGDVTQVEPWMTSFNPGVSTMERLIELTRECDFAAFVFARDDWTAAGPAAPDGGQAGQASPRDNVVFEAGLFAGALGLRRTFILHAKGAKLPTDLLGLTSVRYDGEESPDETKLICEKLRAAIRDQGRIARIEGHWWQFSLTERSAREPSALGLVRISRGRDGALELAGQAWREDGKLSARYWSEAVKEHREPSGIYYYWRGERPLDPDAPQLHGRGEIRTESTDRARGYFTTLSDTQPEVRARTAGDYVRAEPEDIAVLDGADDRQRSELIAARLKHWKGIMAA
jgi:Predicted nucleotide-binding protein containing TIR-like domain